MLHLLMLLTLRPRPPLAVGDGKSFARIEDAVMVAQPGDEIDVYPKASGYANTAVLIRTPGLKIIGKGERILLDGSQFDYSGAGSVPRAIFQIDPNANGVTIENFELTGAHNHSYNGAGIRINAAKQVSIRGCDIHDNDMGIMSNGTEGDPHAGEDQLIDHCEIHENGNAADPGYNHNLYVGGTSVTVQFCNIRHSLTGHNLKCRAHFTLVQYNVITDSDNRELDFVESWDTRRPNSNAVLIGNIIAKDPDCKGNRMTIHFGQEKEHRDGTIYLLNNTIRTPFHSSMLALTGPTVRARLLNNVIENRTDAHPILVSSEGGAVILSVSGSTNVISPSYDLTGTAIDPRTQSTDLSTPPIAASYLDGSGVRQSVTITHRHSPEKGWIKVNSAKIGAGS